MDRYLLITLLFGLIILQIIWLINDPRTPKEILRFSIGLRGNYSRTALIVAIVFIFAKHFFFPNLPAQWPHSQYDGFFTLTGLLLYCIGFTIAVWARMTMKKRWLPAGEGHDTKRQNKLITDGPFRFTRNPIYLGVLLLYFGMGIALRAYETILVLFVLFYFYKSVLQEEKLLNKQFGKAYLEYKSRVRQFI